MGKFLVRAYSFMSSRTFPMSLFVMMPMMSLFFWVSTACVCIISWPTRIRGVVMLSMGNGSSRILLMGCSLAFSPLLSKTALVIALSVMLPMMCPLDCTGNWLKAVSTIRM